MEGNLNYQRYNTRQNNVLYRYRKQCIELMMSGEIVDLSKEIDLDVVDAQNYKFGVNEKVVLIKDRFVPKFVPMVCKVRMDEIC